MKRAELQGRIAALVLLGLVLAAVYALAVQPYLARYQGQQAELAALQDRLVHLERLAQTRPAVHAQLERLRSAEEGHHGYLTGGTPAVATAELQEYVKEVILASGGQLVSTQAVAAENGAGVMPLTVKVTMRGDTESLQRVVYALESGRPMLFLDNVLVRTLGARRMRLGAGREDALEVRFDLTGYLREVRS
jgi:general secretion pathway protein M